MRVLRGLEAAARPPARAVVTVGVFDGVHRAHQHLLRLTARMAGRMRGTSIAVTFDPDPHVVLHPAHPPLALMPLDERLRYIRATGVERVWVIPFTRAFSRITAEAFVRRLLIERLHARVLIVGETFAFGRNRRGDMAVLQSLGHRHEMRIVPVTPIRSGGAPISSSRIRALIHDGRLAQARRLLGRPPALYGRVVRGAGRGRRFGIPTANLQLIPQVLPPQGVYAVRVAEHPGVMNLGTRPTFGPGPVVCEVHLLAYAGSLLGKRLAVSVLRRLRGERCFPSPQALIRQVRRDLARAKRLLSEAKARP